MWGNLTEAAQNQEDAISSRRNRAGFTVHAGPCIRQLTPMGAFSPSCENRPAELDLDKNEDIIWMAPYYFFLIKNISSCVLRTARNKWFCMSPDLRETGGVQLCPGCFPHMQRTPTLPDSKVV